ncbi:MAG: hypothetical protein QOH99_1074, partial [Frankiaceae bacterium]|nr:hypothetical protein [Frankiaceae bacterium]
MVSRRRVGTAVGTAVLIATVTTLLTLANVGRFSHGTREPSPGPEASKSGSTTSLSPFAPPATTPPPPPVTVASLSLAAGDYSVYLEGVFGHQVVVARDIQTRATVAFWLVPTGLHAWSMDVVDGSAYLLTSQSSTVHNAPNDQSGEPERAALAHVMRLSLKTGVFALVGAPIAAGRGEGRGTTPGRWPRDAGIFVRPDGNAA